MDPELAGPDPDRAPSAAFMLIPKVLHAFVADGMAKGRAAPILPSATPPTARQVPDPATVRNVMGGEPEASSLSPGEPRPSSPGGPRLLGEQAEAARSRPGGPCLA